MKKLPTAVAYCRVASRGQRKDKSIANQKKLIKKFARENEIKVVGWFVDTGYNKNYDSGFVNAFARIVKNNRANKPVQYFIATRPDRLSREYLVLLRKMRVLESENVKVICAVGPALKDQTGPLGIFSELFSVAEADHAYQLRMKKFMLTLQRTKPRDLASTDK